MCGMSQTKVGLSACQFCDYEEKPIGELLKEELFELMMPYNYELTEDGARIISVKNERSMRGAIAIPHFVTEIAANAFSGCKFLSRIDLPRALRAIGDGAFANCRDLFDVFIPENVNYIGKGVFADCYDLSVISSAAPAKPNGWSDEWLSGCDTKVEWSSTDES